MALASQAGESPDALLQSLRKPIQNETQSERLTVAVLGFENKTGDSEAEHWRVALEGLVWSELGAVKSVRLAPGVHCALRQINKKEGDAIDAAQARKAGEVIEARRVVWGEYKRIGKNWEVTARVLNVAKGSASKDLKVRGNDWFEMGDKLTDELLKELKVVPTRAEREKMLKHWTKSPEALAWLSEVRLLNEKGKQQSELESYARRAVEADPQYGLAHGVLASIAGSAGRLEEAAKDARRGLELSPDIATVHQVLGVLLLFQGKAPEAEHEFQEAIRLDPDDSENYERLGELYEMREDGAKALDSFRRASQLDPYSSSAHARLGGYYASQNEQQKALGELREAERLAPADDVNTEQFLSNGYRKLRDVPSAILHCDKFVALAKAQGLNPDFVKGYESAFADLRARLTPAFVKADRPTSFSDQDVAKMLREKLTAAEITAVTNPLVSTLAMVNWSRKLTAGATNEFEKGKILLETLAHRATRAVGRGRTAEEVYYAWTDSTVSFVCEEYANLYVALARASGLKCFLAIVDETCDGRKAPHACAALFLEDKCLLADPSFFWYGVPHRQFTVLDDVQVIAVRLAEYGQLTDNLAAYKLYPDSPFICHRLLSELLKNGKSKEAHEMMAKLMQIGGEAWRTNLAQGQFALKEGKLDTAVDLLRKTTELNPDIGEPQLLLDGIYLTQGKLVQAREAYRKALAGMYNEETVEQVNRAVAEINEVLDGSGDGPISRDSNGYQMRAGIYLSESDYEKAIENYSEAIHLEPKEETNYRYRALAYVYQHEFDKALSDCNEALRIKADDSQVYLLRGYAYEQTGEAEKAIADFSETIRLDPKCTEAFKQRGWLYKRQDEYEKAGNDYREVVRLAPNQAEFQSKLAWLLTYCPDKTMRRAAEAIRAGKASCELTGWTNGNYISVLAGAFAELGEYEHAAEYQKQAMDCAGVTPEERDHMSQILTYYEECRWYAEINRAAEAKSGSAKNSSGGSSVGQAMGEAARADLQRAAESGDSAAQLRLANCFYEGAQGFSTNRVEAYKWAMVAAEGGNREGRYLMREAELFMPTEELAQAKTAAHKILESLKKDAADRK